VYRSGRIATEIAGGLEQAMPTQEAVIKFGFPFTVAPTSTVGYGNIMVLGPSFILLIVKTTLCILLTQMHDFAHYRLVLLKYPFPLILILNGIPAAATIVIPSLLQKL